MAHAPPPHGARLADLLPPQYRALVQSWLAEDMPTFDIGGLVVGGEATEAHLLCKGAPEGAGGAAVGGAVLAGVPFFTAVFEHLGCSVEWHAAEGAVLAPPARAATVRGPARAVLQGERTALNILTRASGVATAARAMALVRAREGWHGEVAGSRKLTPGGFRLVEKYALLVGGVSTHRMDLSQMTTLKGA
jgi:nicotinate-nucleotide pyrophosphorylase (carboxylating)